MKSKKHKHGPIVDCLILCKNNSRKKFNWRMAFIDYFDLFDSAVLEYETEDYQWLLNEKKKCKGKGYVITYSEPEEEQVIEVILI